MQEGGARCHFLSSPRETTSKSYMDLSFCMMFRYCVNIIQSKYKMRDKCEDNERLLLRLRCGDDRALSEMMERYFVPLCDFCHLFIGDMAVSEELVSDVFYTVWSKRITLEIHTSLKSYLYASVRNNALKNRRNLSASRSVPLDSLTSEAVDSDNVLTQLMQRELSDDVMELIQTLPEKRRVIFELNRFESFTYKEIAALLQISEKTVQNQMSLAIKYLRPRIRLLLNNMS